MAHLPRVLHARCASLRSGLPSGATVTPVPFALTVLTVGLLAACGDTTADAPGATAGEGCNAAGAMATVEIPDFAFEPTPVEIDRCDEVVWSNAHDQPHTSTGQGDQRWSTGNLAPGDTSEPVLFETAGTFTYICALHPFMEGTVTVG